MNWFVRYRLDWIGETLEVFGFVNREHLVRKFGISVPQASADLRDFQRLRPGIMTYDKNRKCYVRDTARETTTLTSDPRPLSPAPLRPSESRP